MSDEIEEIFRRHGAGELYAQLSGERHSYFTPSLDYAAKLNRGELAPGEAVEIDAGNSRTLVRLMAGWLAGQQNLRGELAAVPRESLIAIVDDLERLVRPSRLPEANAARAHWRETRSAIMR